MVTHTLQLTDDLKAHIQSRIRPLPPAQEYLTGWAGCQPFETIYNDLTPNLNRLLRHYGAADCDIPDLVAHAFMKLWQTLTDNPLTLAPLDKGGALKWLCAHANVSVYRKWRRREIGLVDLVPNSEEEDMVIEGFDRGGYAAHAIWARRVELRIDIERAMTQIANRHINSLPHLAAIYYITTSVRPDDAAAIAGRSGTRKDWWLTSVVKPMRKELGDLLGLREPNRRDWRACYRDGMYGPLRRQAARYEAEGKIRLLETLYSLARHESAKALMERLKLPKSHIHYLRLTVHRDLNRAYGVMKR